MPKTKSAKRALKKTKERRRSNLTRKREIKVAVKDLLKTLAGKNKEEAGKKLALAYKKIDKAAKTYMHKNKANRLKSQLARKTFKHLNI